MTRCYRHGRLVPIPPLRYCVCLVDLVLVAAESGGSYCCFRRENEWCCLLLVPIRVRRRR